MLKKILSNIALALVILSPSILLAGNPAYIVEIANFSCPHCAAMERHYEEIERAAEATGGSLSFAPISWGDQSDWRDRFYYSAAINNKADAELIRRSIYRAAAQSGQPLENIYQVKEWLLQDVGNLINIDEIQEGAYDEDVEAALEKTKRLIAISGIQSVPSYIIIRDGAVIKSIERIENEQYNDYKERIIQEIRSLEK